MKYVFEKTSKDIKQVVKKAKKIINDYDIAKKDKEITFDNDENICQNLDKEKIDIDEATSKNKKNNL